MTPIPFWLRVAGMAIGAVIGLLMVISAFTAGARSPLRPRRSPPPPGPVPTAAPSPTVPSTALPNLPAPLPSAGFRDPDAVAGAFAVNYRTWIGPDGPPGSATRVEPYATPELFAHFPEPTSWPAPSALATVDAVTDGAVSAQSRMVAVSVTQHLVGQDGRPIAAPVTTTMSVTVDQQPDGAWLVAAFSPGSE
ncbi:MAG: hypothetical protein M3063_04990 [Actinomycetota bacterium]|nr:hypothetical protein [Actinomycetota bacterium]